jgi:S1-C subfamily serine protease
VERFLGVIPAITLICAYHFALPTFSYCQAPGSHPPDIPVATQWTLQAVPSGQRETVKSVFLIVCRKAAHKGTAFLLKSGTVVTNFHVVDGCAAEDLWARSSMGHTVSFSKMITDDKRDLAILRPFEHLDGGLDLGPDEEPSPEAVVKTWGFPLSYEGLAPLLSMGYVAGYMPRKAGERTVKHLIINGAFNPGNSGGPLILGNSNRVVGVVVTKWTLFSPDIETAIYGLNHTPTMTSSGVTQTLPDGTKKFLSNEQVTALALQDFYEVAQVMIGEAISVSELKSLLREKEAALSIQ